MQLLKALVTTAFWLVGALSTDALSAWPSTTVGVECRDEDWAKVHKLVCKENQVRKMKWGKQDRKQKGLEKVEEFVKECAELE